MSIEKAQAVMELLDDEQHARLKSISVTDNGTVIELYPPGLSMLPGGQLVAAHPQHTPNGEGLLGDRQLLEGIDLTAFVDLMTLTAIAKDEPFHVGWDTVAMWVEVDAGELSRFMENNDYEYGLGVWRSTLHAAEQRDLKAALKNVLAANTRAPISETIEALSKSEDISEDLRKHIVTRWTLNEQVAAVLRLAQEAAEAEATEDDALPED